MKHNICTVLPDFYKNTIIGNVFTFSDYFLKGFFIGCYFPIDFVIQWNKFPSNKRKLSSQINIKRKYNFG